MRWPFTTYATGTLLAFTLPLLALTVVLKRTAPGVWWLLPLALALFVFSFFRDPQRSAPGGEDELASPADGLVSDIVTLEDPALGRSSVRIGIFLSVFDVHVNRVPCSGTIVRVDHREGGFHDARDDRAIAENQAATIVIERPDGRQVGVRQITGLIARRIICPVQPGDPVVRGDRYGMIRFGSRTELIIDVDDLDEVLVSVGDRVRGGETILARMQAAAR